jgi:PKHD-type hydroxylase
MSGIANELYALAQSQRKHGALAGSRARWHTGEMSTIVIERAIPQETLAKIRTTIAAGPFIAGKETAEGGAADVKHNLQLAQDSPAAAAAGELLTGALEASTAFQTATWGEAMMRPLFCRYEPGMQYGDHIDGALMGAPVAIRCDIAVTVCLNDGASYEGGELVIDDVAGASRGWKGRAGDAIVYAADTLHRVSTVASGVREVAVLWIQSSIRDAGKRRILYDLKTALDVLDRSPQPPPHVQALRRSYFNLVRMWA